MIGPSPDDINWKDMGTYWLNINKQSTSASAKRHGWGPKRLLTCSNFATAAGHNTRFSSPADLAYNMITEKREPILEDHEKTNIERGIRNEPIARELYERIYGVKVIEVGLAVPKFDIRIGTAVDGMVDDDGCIEIKCPAYIYPKLKHMSNGDPKTRIYSSHYDQMQGSMAICNRKWCDYIVYGVEEGKLYVERVSFDHKYWHDDLYPKLTNFIEYVMPEVSLRMVIL